MPLYRACPVCNVPMQPPYSAEGSLDSYLCRPNAYQSFRGGKLQLRVIKPIEKGEEICIAYRPLEQPSFDRRLNLLSNFGFDSRPDVRPMPCK